MTSASSRVHDTSYTSAAKPEIAAAVQASRGAGESTVEREDRRGRKDSFSEEPVLGDDFERRACRARRALFFRSAICGFSARSAGSALFVRERLPISPSLAACSDERRPASHIAPVAATTFSATPTHVVPRRPRAGMSQKPAPIAPSAAPAVFVAYSVPVSPASAAYQPAAMGKVAPIAAAGMPRSARLVATRIIAKRAGAVPSAYAHAS